MCDCESDLPGDLVFPSKPKYRVAFDICVLLFSYFSRLVETRAVVERWKEIYTATDSIPELEWKPLSLRIPGT
jgi:hypothetical protein